MLELPMAASGSDEVPLVFLISLSTSRIFIIGRYGCKLRFAPDGRRSKEYQLSRFRRLERSDKHLMFNPGDLKERILWDDYRQAFEIALERCSMEQALGTSSPHAGRRPQGLERKELVAKGPQRVYLHLACLPICRRDVACYVSTHLP